MKRIVSSILLVLYAALTVTAQISVTGRVIDSANSEPLAGVSLILRNAEGKIKKYGSTDSDGHFKIETESTDGCRLDVSMIGFAKQKIMLDGKQYPLSITMSEADFQLKEVAVKADRIREQGDTITYTVGTFAQARDRSIGDVLKRMPGIEVQNSGKIKYQGEDINKFYIEGSDLLGGKYGVATNGINHEDVGAVEVMENHQPMQVLSGISFSDKAAINLKLKNKAKAVWTVHGDAGAGYSWQPDGVIRDGEIFAMAVMPSFQNITTFKTNNAGNDLSALSTDFFADRRSTALDRYVSVSLPPVASLNRNRTLFNRSALVSTNSLWKINGGELKAQIDYSFNRIRSSAARVTTYFLNGGNRVVTENRDGSEHEHAVSGKFIYEVNKKTMFLNNTLKTEMSWDNTDLHVDGTLPNVQSTKLPDYYVSNKFKMIKRFNGKHLITFESLNEWESLPQTLGVDMNGSIYRQHVGNNAFFTRESAAYAFSFHGITLSLEGGIKGYVSDLDTEMNIASDLIPGTGDSNTWINYFTVYLVPGFEYWIKRVNISLNTPVGYSAYTFDKAISDRSEVYFSPSLSLNWKPVNRLSMTLRGGSNRSPMNLGMIHNGLILTDYRTLRGGVDDFYSNTSQNISASINYRNTRHGLFANALARQSWTHRPYTTSQQLSGDYVIYSYADAKSSAKNFLTMGTVGKTLDFMSGSANVSGSFNRTQSRLISESDFVTSVSSSWDAGIRINGAPLRWISFDYALNIGASRLLMNSNNARWLSEMTNSLTIDIMPASKWRWEISGEHYRNEYEAGTYKSIMMLDTRLIFKASRRIEISANLSNILDERNYNYTTYNQFGSVEACRQLRGRQLLLTINLKK